MTASQGEGQRTGAGGAPAFSLCPHGHPVLICVLSSSWKGTGRIGFGPAFVSFFRDHPLQAQLQVPLHDTRALGLDTQAWGQASPAAEPATCTVNALHCGTECGLAVSAAATGAPLSPQLFYLVSVGLCVAVVAAFGLPAFTFRENLAATALLLVLFGCVT